MKIGNWLILGGVVIGGYYLWKKFNAAKTVVINAQQAAGSSLADAAQFLLGNGIATPGTTYDVHMPDGSIQTVAYGHLPVSASQYVAPLSPGAQSALTSEQITSGYNTGG